MSDFQTVQKRGAKVAPSTVKYASQQQQLVEMGFDVKKVQKTLETTRGDLEKATAMLLGDESHNEDRDESKPVSEKIHAEKKGDNSRTTRKSVAPAAVEAPPSFEGDYEDLHRKMMTCYKINKCKDYASKTHDRKNCMNWHSYSDRRRNPFENTYSSYECPNVVSGAECPTGDSCGHSHNMLERMFHPELYKISFCERSEGGRKCDRGIYCAFAHAKDDLRVSPSKLDPSLADKPPAKPVTADIVIPDEIKDRLIELIKDSGKEGVHSSEIYKKYQIKFGEPLDFSNDKYGAKFKMKEMLESHSNISCEFTRGHQPVYVFVEAGVVEQKKSEVLESNPDAIRDRLVSIIKTTGLTGIIGADLPKKYHDTYGERLELVDDAGVRLKLKEMLQSQPGIIVAPASKTQLKYSYDSSLVVVQEKPKTKSWSSIAAGPDKSKIVANLISPEVTKAPQPAPVVVEEDEEQLEQPQPVAPKAPAMKSFAAVVAAKAAEAPVSVLASDSPVVATTISDSAVELQAQLEQKPDPPISIATEVSNSVVEQLLASVTSPEPFPSAPSLNMSTDATSISKLVSDITESPVALPPSVFPLSSESSLSSSLLFGIESKEDQNNVSQQSKLHELLYKASSSLEMKRPEHSIMPPGLTKQPKASEKLEDENNRKLSQAQAQIAILQDQVSQLQKDLTARKTEFDNQSILLRSAQQRLKELESDEHFKAQLKAKDDEYQLYFTQLQDRNAGERVMEYSQNTTVLNQMESHIEQLKLDDVNPDMIPKEKSVEMLRTLAFMRQYCNYFRVQWKTKADQYIASRGAPFIDPYASRFQYPTAGGLYDHQQSYFGSAFSMYGNSYGAHQQQCEWPGCNLPGVYQCTGCYHVSYCSPEHQSMHYSQHITSCNNSI